MSHNHEHTNNERGIKFGLVLNSAFTIVEFVFGTVTGSLALIADATHNLTDVFTLGVSFVANRLARQKANDSKTFGYGRVTILAALLNASIMLAIAGYIVVEAIQRLTHPQQVVGGVIVVIALVGVGVNSSIAYVLSKNRQDLNMRSAFVDMALDALSSFGAVIAGLLIMFTGINGIDSVVGLLIAALLLYNVFKILGEAVQVLLEGTPKDVDITAIAKAITSADRVLEVDDLHIWSIRSNYNALSCHIVINEKDLSRSRSIVERVKDLLRNEHAIQHATIEVELQANTKHEKHERH
ncbi:MAG: cation transporter [Candidatus Saccharimonas sp.]|nr:cation transporter [Candidatus Saccharimonas sp.]